MYKLIGNQDIGDIVVENAGYQMIISKILLSYNRYSS